MLESTKIIDFAIDFLKNKGINAYLYLISNNTEKYNCKTYKINFYDYYNSNILIVTLVENNKYHSFKLYKLNTENELKDELNKCITMFKLINKKPDKLPLPPMETKIYNYDIYDSSIENTDKTPILKALTNLYKAYEKDIKAVLFNEGINIVCTIENHFFANKDKVLSYDITNFTLEIPYKLKDKKNTKQYYFKEKYHKLNDFYNIDLTKKIFAQIVNCSHDTQQIFNKNINLILTNMALVKFLNFLAKKTILPNSMFANKQNKFFDINFNLNDDGMYSTGYNTRPFDATGWTVTSKQLFKNGFLNEPIIPNYYNNQPPTGNAFFDNSFNIIYQPTNLIMEKGKFKKNEYIFFLDPGVILHDINSILLDDKNNIIINGNGEYFNKQKKAFNVKQLYIKTNFYSFLKKIKYIGEEQIKLQNIVGYPILMENINASTIEDI